MLSEKADGKMAKAGYLLGTPSEHCKQYGLTLEAVSKATGVSRQTLGNWHKNKPRLFEVVVRGCVK